MDKFDVTQLIDTFNEMETTHKGMILAGVVGGGFSNSFNV